MAAGSRRQTNNPIAKLRADLAKRQRPFYLFHGENQWFRSESVKLLREMLLPADGAEFSYEERRLDSHSDWADVEAMLRSYSFFGGKKLIHLEIPGKLEDETRAALSRFLEEKLDQNILCLSAPNLSQLTAAKNRIEKAGGLALKFEVLKERELLAWTAEHMRSLGLDFEQRVPEMLIDALPADPGEIAGEVEKLRLLIPAGGKIRSGDIKRLVGRQKIDEVWKLAGALKRGGEAEAMRLLIELLESGGQKPVSLLPALSYTITMLLRARLLLDEGYSHAAAADALPLWSGRAREYVSRAAGMPKRELLVWVFNLQKLDYRLKRSTAEIAGHLMASTLLESLAGRYLRA